MDPEVLNDHLALYLRSLSPLHELVLCDASNRHTAIDLGDAELCSWEIVLEDSRDSTAWKQISEQRGLLTLDPQPEIGGRWAEEFKTDCHLVLFRSAEKQSEYKAVLDVVDEVLVCELRGERNDQDAIVLKTSFVHCQSSAIPDYVSDLEITLHQNEFTLRSLVSHRSPSVIPPSVLQFHSYYHSPVLSFPSPTTVVNIADVKQWGLALLTLHSLDTRSAMPVGFTAGIHAWDVLIRRCTTQYMGVGVACIGTKLNSYLGRDFTGWSFQPTGEKWHSNIGYSYGPPRPSYCEGDCITVELDLVHDSLAFYKNNQYLGVAFTGLLRECEESGLFPAVTSYRAGDTIDVVGLRNGQITDTFPGDSPDGLTKWMATWVQGTRHGFGCQEYANGEKRYGVWVNGFCEGCVLSVSASSTAILWFEGDRCCGTATPQQVQEAALSGTVPSIIHQLQDVQPAPLASQPTHTTLSAVTGHSSLSATSLFHFSGTNCAAGITLSEDRFTATCTTNSRCMLLGSRAFQSGRFYWEVRVNSCDVGSLFIGVSSRLPGSSHQCWRDYGFVNNHTIQDHANESYYGVQYYQGDVIGVLLDMDLGRLSFFKYGSEFYYSHNNVIELGVACRNIRTADSLANQSILLYPSFGFRRAGDCITILAEHCLEGEGVTSGRLLRDVLLWKQIACCFGWDDGMVSVKSKVNCAESETNSKEDDDSMDRGKDGVMHWKEKDHTINHDTHDLITRNAAKKTVKAAVEAHWKWYIRANRIRIVSKVGIPVDLDCAPDVLESVQETETHVPIGTRFSQLWYQDKKAHTFWFQEMKTGISHGTAATSAEDPSIDWDQVFSVDLLKDVQSWVNDLSESLHRPLTALTSSQLKSLPRPSDLQCIPSTTLEVMVSLLQLADEVGSTAIPLLHPVHRKNGDQVLPSPFLKSLVTLESKKRLFQSYLEETALTHTHTEDDFDRPLIIPEFRVCRVAAKKAQLSGETTASLVQHSVLNQLAVHMETVPLSSLRKQFNHAEDAGQKRCFFVRLVGEGVYDSGGPYREVLTTAAAVEPFEQLQLATPCSNWEGGTTEEEMWYIRNGQLSPSEYNRICYFWGVTIGIAVRGSVALSLPLSPVFWKQLVGEEISTEDLRLSDEGVLNAIRHWDEVSEACGGPRSVVAALPCSERSKALLLSQNESIGTQQWCYLVGDCIVRDMMIWNQAVIRGITAILPDSILSIFSPAEMKEVVCGGERITVESLQAIAEYGEGVSASANVIQRFWRVVTGFTNTQRSQLLEFVCARTRIPVPPSPPISFKIVVVRGGDATLPQSQTCFSILKLPSYSSDEVMKKQLIYAMENTPTMELDVQLHDAEGWSCRVCSAYSSFTDSTNSSLTHLFKQGF